MFQLAIKGGAVIDGAGKPAFRADIGIRDGKVAVSGNFFLKSHSTTSDHTTGSSHGA